MSNTDPIAYADYSVTEVKTCNLQEENPYS
jgi:hypothetical protein